MPDPETVQRCRERDIVTLGTATTVAAAVALDAGTAAILGGRAPRRDAANPVAFAD